MAKEKSRSSLFIRLMYFFNSVAVIFLSLSYLSAYVSPGGNFWWLQFIGLALGVLLLINILFVIFWILLRRKEFLLSLLLLLLGYQRIAEIVQFHSASKNISEESKSAGVMKVMSFNVRTFDLYNWFHNSETRKNIFDFLQKESPDVVCFQEYYSSEKKDANYNNDEALPKIIPAKYSYIENVVTLRDSDHWGIATFSKYKIIHNECTHFQKAGGGIFICSDIVNGNDTFRIINAHLESIRLRDKDYKVIESISSDKEEKEWSGTVNILRKMKRAFTRRTKQVEILRAAIENSPYPVIVCGDFNDTPASYTYHQLSKGLKDSFCESGSGFGNTYAGIIPYFRIDYILHDKKLKSETFKRYKEKLSDHYPISCLIEMKNPE